MGPWLARMAVEPLPNKVSSFQSAFRNRCMEFAGLAWRWQSVSNRWNQESWQPTCWWNKPSASTIQCAYKSHSASSSSRVRRAVAGMRRPSPSCAASFASAPGARRPLSTAAAPRWWGLLGVAALSALCMPRRDPLRSRHTWGIPSRLALRA